MTSKHTTALTPTVCRDARREQGLTTDDLAAALGVAMIDGDALGIPASAIEAFESGKVQLADEALVRVSAALAVPAEVEAVTSDDE